VIAAELVKEARRPWTWVVLGVMAAVPCLLTAVIGLTRPTIAERVGDWGSVVTSTSGLTVPLIALSAMQLFLLPLGVAVFAGEAVAGDASWGSLRYLLARPVSRSRVLVSKAGVAAGLSAAAVAAVALSSVVSGVLAFGWRPLTVLDLQHTTPFQIAAETFAPAAAAGRVGLASVLVACTMASTFAFAILLSTLTNSPFSAAAGGVGLGLVSRALDNVPGLHELGRWLPLTDASSTLWTGLFLQPVDLAGIGHLALVQALYTAAFLAAAWAWFTRSDVLT
jgi:ABC-2 type transport system permease protein